MNNFSGNIEQIYTGCLAQGAYYIVSGNEAAIIDPLRETQPYLNRLQQDGVTLKYIFETHFHADFVSGHIDLSTQTNAPIVYGPNASPNFSCIQAKDEQEFSIGDSTIKVLHTPGHTLESTCYLLKDKSGKDIALFSGDTLFLGDVGRPDLAQQTSGITQEELAGLLYDSLYTKILPLADDIIVYPAHGAGSACGKNMMKETVDTLGNQKLMNYALNQPTKAAFIEAVTDGLLPPPKYFGANVALNKNGYGSFDDVLKAGLTQLSPQRFNLLAQNGDITILDTRNSESFSQGFIAGSINIGLKGDFAPWVGAIIGDINRPLILVTDTGAEEEAVTRLSRVGFDNILGYLHGGMDEWMKNGNAVSTVRRISAHQFAEQFEAGISKVVDVRKEAEYVAEHVKDAFNRPLANIQQWMAEINTDEHFYLHCAGGYRSMIAASILQAEGIINFTEVAGGFSAISQTNIPVTDYVCSSKMCY